MPWFAIPYIYFLYTRKQKTCQNKAVEIPKGTFLHCMVLTSTCMLQTTVGGDFKGETESSFSFFYVTTNYSQVVRKQRTGLIISGPDLNGGVLLVCFS